LLAGVDGVSELRKLGQEREDEVLESSELLGEPRAEPWMVERFAGGQLLASTDKLKLWPSSRFPT